MSKQIQILLSRKAWEGIIINENNEPLIEVQETEKIIYGQTFGSWYEGNSYNLRKTVADMVIAASQYLPTGYKLVLIEGVRPLSKQKKHWDAKIEEFAKPHPDWTPEKVEQEVAFVVARPNPLANHNCGGAVDVGLAYENGMLVDMGTLPQELKEKKYVEMFSELITDAQKKNRAILRTAMEQAGFVWYPGEWWHYCWGDRMWAVYSGRTECYYGPIELEQ